MFKCLAIIVSYNPDLILLEKLINAISAQVAQIILIDNASDTQPIDILGDPTEKIEYLQLKNNLGLGVAHNLGIDYAEKNSFSHVLILDQDSLPDEDMVFELYKAEQSLLKQGISVAAVGPQFISLHDDNKTAFIYETKGKCKRAFCKANEYIKTEHLISSGSLMSIVSLKEIGYMEEDLFIDFVDIEWGLRAKSLNYDCYGICSANMHHQLGDKNLHIKAINRRIVLHSSLRYYYQFRNAILIYKRSYVPWAWIKYHFPRHIFVKFFILLFFTPSRFKNISSVLLGIWHGILNKSGKI